MKRSMSVTFSIAGVFFRKMIVFLDKLTFPQTVKVYRLYQKYVLMGKDSLRNSESYKIIERRSVSPMVDDERSQSLDTDASNMSNTDMERTAVTGNMEIGVITQNPLTNPIVALFGITPSS